MRCKNRHCDLWEMVKDIERSSYSTPLEDFSKLDFSHLTRKTTCKKMTCGLGKYKVYGEITGGYGYRCDLCPINHYKSTVGDDGCIPCRGQFSIDNGYRTKCIDPYKNIHPNSISMTLFQIILTFSSLGTLTSIATIGVFVRKKNTPVIKVSDFKMSILHLMTILIIFVMVPILKFMEPSREICIARVTINISIAYVLNASLVFVKSQKLLRACLSKIKLTPSEIKQTVSLQIFIVFVLLLISNVLTVILFYGSGTTLSSYVNEQKLERVHFCNTSLHSSIVIAFIMVIQFACFVQAFRGRHLPSERWNGFGVCFIRHNSHVYSNVCHSTISR